MVCIRSRWEVYFARPSLANFILALNTALASLQQGVRAAARAFLHAVGRDGRFAGQLPLALERFLARAAADVVPREYLIERALAGRIKRRIKAAVSKGLHPLVKVKTLVPAVHLAAALPGEVDRPALPAVAAGDHALEHRGLGVMPVVGDVFGLHDDLHVRLLFAEQIGRAS